METVILTAAPPGGNGRRLSYVVEGEPLDVAVDINEAIDAGHFYEVPDRESEKITYVNPAQIVSVYEKPERA